MAYADRTGKRLVIGLEFNPGEPAKPSFHGMDEATYGGRHAFDGFVFHHYEGYRRFVGASVPVSDSASSLPERERPGKPGRSGHTAEGGVPGQSNGLPPNLYVSCTK